MAIKNKIRVLILGGSGMLGHAVFRHLSQDPKLEVYATIRNPLAKKDFSAAQHKHILIGVDVENTRSLSATIKRIKPAVVINCIGIVKQLEDSHDALKSIPINALLPHQLANICQMTGARLILISTDCVFSGRKGNYTELDFADCEDLYGRSKLLGEIANSPHVLTIRTSIIGHEIASKNGLLEWFLSQKGEVSGFKNAIFSGLTTTELARILKDIILHEKNLFGLFHVSTKPISKYDLLQLIAKIYQKNIKIKPRSEPKINRSLSSRVFSKKTGYKTKSWPVLIQEMLTEFTNSALKK